MSISASFSLINHLLHYTINPPFDLSTHVCLYPSPLLINKFIRVKHCGCEVPKPETVSSILYHTNETHTGRGACDHPPQKKKKRKCPLHISLSKRTLPKDPFHSQCSHPGDRGMGAPTIPRNRKCCSVINLLSQCHKANFHRCSRQPPSRYR